ncbi:MAG: 4Fe-4S binding protein [Elusimicrobia bacterium]|nr:4Fe-4S binding protein [Candidatus Liberimonas magnetica]
MKRQMIEIDEDKCIGCGNCITGCPEGALKIIDTPKGPKAKLVKENFCDGLGACIGECPVDALQVVEREADEYDEKGVIRHIKKTAPDKLGQHIEHLKKHGMEIPEEFNKEGHTRHPFEMGGCPGSRTMDWGEKKTQRNEKEEKDAPRAESELRQWPVQLSLVNPQAAYFDGADLLIAADCVPFAYANFHSDFLKDKRLVIGCPKLDDIKYYKDKLTELFKTSNIKSVTVLNMEVPCCFGLQKAVQDAIVDSKKKIPYCDTTITLQGEIKE